tara:strand:+ start:7716 stop:7940 length:225 start_codon:yes stop_codon:yes gene_type:complete
MESIEFIESPESAVLRINAETISYLGNMLAEILQYEDKETKATVIKLLSKHSDFILDTSDKIVTRQKLNVSLVS